ncbi:MAG: hypothetical protein HKP61_03590 [Dactylosporangium sp.]|nr:ferredoxin [Dactylosporangium sp.]NNJ60036.1 hypothetical protein [Dactylosporangium sp.]
MQDPQHGVYLVVTAVGFSALAMLWLGLVAGLVLRDGRAIDRIRPATLASLHRTAVSCGLTLAVVHALGQLAVPSSEVRVIDLLIPFLHERTQFGVGLGVVGLDLMFMVAGSVALRRFAGYTRWRFVHRLGYLAFALLLGHVCAVGAGTYHVAVIGPIVVIGAGTIALGLATAGWVSRLPHRVRDLLAEGRWGRRVAVHVDATRCVHFGFCQHEAPDLFELRDDGRLDHASTARANQIDAAIRAARACPTRAILLSRRAGRVVFANPGQDEDEVPSPPGGSEEGSGEHAVA